MNRAYDIAVVGAGVFGAWTAYRFAQTGRSVLLIDRFEPGDARSSSGAETRIMRMGYGEHEVYTRFAQESLAAWMEFPRFFRKTGVAWFAPRKSDRIAAARAALDRARIRFEELSATGIEQRYPGMSFGPEFTALLEPESGVLLASEAVRAVVQAATGAGAEFLRDAVRAPVGSGSEIWTENNRRIAASQFVFTCGAWLPKLFPDLLDTVISPTRQPLFYFTVPPQNNNFDAEQMPAWIEDTEPSFPYGCPSIDGSGLKLGFHRLGERFDPDSGAREVASTEVEEARRYVASRFPALARAPLRAYAVCQYENTPSGDFLIDRHPTFPNVWLTGGGSGHGFKHGPAVANYIVRRIEGRIEEQPRFALAKHRVAGARAVI